MTRWKNSIRAASHEDAKIQLTEGGGYARRKPAELDAEGEVVLETRGLGDRWLAGDAIDGVLFAHHDAVAIVEGPYSGERGSVVLLMGIRPQATYLVELDSGRADVRVRQSELRAAG